MSLTVWSWLYFGIFFIFMVFLALRGLKKTTRAVDFSTAPRAYGPFTIGIALTATTGSAAAILGNPGMVYAQGWPALWYAMGGYSAIALAWASSAFVLSRIGKNAQAKSMADFMAIRFQSPLLRVLTALAAIFSIFYIAGQFAGLGLVFVEATGIDYLSGVIIGSILMAAYISIGGSHADILTSFIQGLIMVLLGVMITVVVLINVGGIGTIDRELTQIDPALSSSVVFNDPMFGPFTGIAIFISLGLFGLSPQLSKMWLALDDEKNVSKALLWGFFGISVLALIMWLGGLGSRVMFPDVAPDTAILYLLIESLPDWLTGLAMVGILSAILSTTAGLFLVVSVAMAVDIYRDSIVPLRKKKISEAVLDKKVLMLQRIFIPILVIGGILIAQNEPAYITQLMWLGIGLFTGSVIPAMVIGSLWKGVTRKAAEIGSIAGFLTFIFLTFIVGLGMQNEFFLVPWAAAGISTIVATVFIVVISFFTKPLDKAYIDKLFAK
ncbi:sodium:solute symporter family protein [Oceanobacillus jeddahense]|nr:hypothetical protein [Oceanobacillus jeddahense]